MQFLNTFSRLLWVFAVVGLILAPMASPSAAMGGMAEMSGMSDGMPCCPDQKAPVPDCQKSCPLAAICVAKCFANASLLTDFGGTRLEMVDLLVRWDDAALAVTAISPPHPPPRS